MLPNMFDIAINLKICAVLLPSTDAAFQFSAFCHGPINKIGDSMLHAMHCLKKCTNQITGKTDFVCARREG